MELVPRLPIPSDFPTPHWAPHGPHACDVDHEQALVNALVDASPGRHREMIVREMKELGVGRHSAEGLSSAVWQPVEITPTSERSNATGWFAPSHDAAGHRLAMGISPAMPTRHALRQAFAGEADEAGVQTKL